MNVGLDPKEREDKRIQSIEPKFPTIAMGKWEEGLMTSTSLPQLFLYLTTLGKYIYIYKILIPSLSGSIMLSR